MDHPPFGLLLGGIPGIGAVRYGLGPGNLELMLAAAVIGLGAGVLLLNLTRAADLPGLVCLGFGGFVLLTLFYWYPYQHKRRLLRNHRVHLSGRLRAGDPSRFVVGRINRRPARGLFYLGKGAREHIESERGREETNRSLAITATVRWPFDSPGFANYLAANRYLGYLEVHRRFGRNPEPRLAGRPQVGFYDTLRAGLRERTRQWPLSARLLRTLLLGERDALPQRLEVLLRRLGLTHLFVISGLHVGLLYLLLVGCLNRLRVPGGWFLPLTLVFLTLYLSFLGWPVSATRAGVMVLLLELVRSGLRRCSHAEVLLSTVLVLLLYDPLMLYRVGFQFSAAAVAGIILVRERSWIRLHHPWARWLLVNVGAFLGVFPLLLHHFHVGSAWGWLFSFLAGAVFPVFLGLLTLQGVLIGTWWTAPAAVVETLFHSGIRLARESIGRLPTMLGVGGLSLPGVLGCWLLTWLILSRTSGRVGRGIGLLLVSAMLGLLWTAPRPGLTEIGAAGGMGFVRVQTPGNRQLVVLDPGRSPTARRMRALDRQLRRRGVSHVHTIVGFTDCRRIRESVVTLSLGRCRFAGDGMETVRWPGGAFSWRSGRLHLPYVTVSIGPRGSGDELARAGRFCLYRSAGESREDEPQTRPCTPVDVGEAPMVWRPDRPPEHGAGGRSVEQTLLDALFALSS